MDDGGLVARRVLIALPALNESASVASVVSHLRAACPWADILVVDDGSIDDTASEAARAGAHVCRLPFNLGVGGAMRTAYKLALRKDYDVVVQVDADGQHNPAHVCELISRLDDADVVVGARFAGRGEYQVAAPRRLAMRLLARVLTRFAGTELTDVTSGFRAVNRRGIRLFAAHYPAEYLGDTVESLVIALRSGLVVAQVPVEMRPRAFGSSTASFSRASLYLLRAFAALGLALVRRWPMSEVVAPGVASLDEAA